VAGGTDSGRTANSDTTSVEEWNTTMKPLALLDLDPRMGDGPVNEKNVVRDVKAAKQLPAEISNG
jgi:hypothetical protein